MTVESMKDEYWIEPWASIKPSAYFLIVTLPAFPKASKDSLVITLTSKRVVSVSSVKVAILCARTLPRESKRRLRISWTSKRMALVESR